MLPALLSGICWGAGTVLIRKSPQIDPMDIVPMQYIFAVIISVIFLIMATTTTSLPAPTSSAWLAAMPYLIGFYVLIILPTLYICVRSSQVISPGRAGLLMMSEVLVAGISAPLIAGESLTAREFIAAVFIIAAAIIEITSSNQTD